MTDNLQVQGAWFKEAVFDRRRERQVEGPTRNEGAWQGGKATWYPDRPAACYDRKRKGQPARRTQVPRSIRLWAAHKSLPCGTIVEVRYGGRRVRVPIMDRGPYGPGRVLDLSTLAFQKLSPLSVGVMRVRWRVVKYPRTA